MLSIAIVGRNDSHGYNMHKRLAICLNGLAHLLEDLDDEILFVDCNTRDDLPTLAEAISDTLTEKTKQHLRIFRVRPALFRKMCRGSSLPISESLCKNIAIRRSNAKNRWFLSTTSDIVLLIKEGGLHGLLSSLKDGFYELPRFGIPEMLWETLPRMDPEKIRICIREWGRTFRLNHVVHVDRPEILYDAPGDFQLCLREQLFQIGGFDERMVDCYHQDTNLARRLHLLNGVTQSLLEHAYCYHCDHTLLVDYLHKKSGKRLPANDWDFFVCGVTSPFVLHQKEIWGGPKEEIEEIRLQDVWREPSPVKGLKDRDYTEEFFTPISKNSALCYDLNLVFPFVCNQLNHLRDLSMLYVGRHAAMMEKLKTFVGERGCEIVFVPEDRSLEKLSVIFIDLFYEYDFVEERQGIKRPQKHMYFSAYKKSTIKHVKAAIALEKKRRRLGYAPAKFIFIGLEHTWAKRKFFHYFELALTQYSSHVSYGYVTEEACKRGGAHMRKIREYFYYARQVKKIIRKGKETIQYLRGSSR